MPESLQRFKDAQSATFAEALDELRAGQKKGHWIWFILPQLRGLGWSPQSVYYGLDGPAEAQSYLRDPLLRDRLCEALAVVHAQACERGVLVERLMGSTIDAQKLVSSLTLFAHVAAALDALEPSPALATLARHARDVLTAAAGQGLPACSFTLGQL